MSKVIIVNLRDNPTYHFRVDRASPLGNPIPINKSAPNQKLERDMVCDYYEGWLQQKIRDKNKDVCDMLNKIYAHARDNPETILACWCVPKRCHAETIKRVVEEKLEKLA